MPTIKKYIIKPDNVKNPFKMRATSPAKKVALTGDGTSKDYSHFLQSNMPSVTYNKPKLDTNTKTGDGLLDPIKGGGVITEIGKDTNQENLDNLKAATTKKENVRTPGLTRRIDKASNPAKKERLKGKRERKQLRQDTREGLIKQRNVEKLENRTGERMQERTDRFRTRRGADVVQERQAAIGSSMSEVNKMQANVSSMSLGNRFKEKSKSLNATARKTNELNLKSSALGIDNLQQRANVPQQTKKQRFESRAETLKHGKRKNKLINKALDVHEGYAEGDVNKYRNKLKRKNIMVTELENDSPLNVRKKFRQSSGADKSKYKIYKSERVADSIAKVGKMKSDVSKLKIDTSSKLGNTTSYKPGFGVKPASKSVIKENPEGKIGKIENTNSVSDNKFTKNFVRVSNISNKLTRPSDLYRTKSNYPASEEKGDQRTIRMKNLERTYETEGAVRKYVSNLAKGGQYSSSASDSPDFTVFAKERKKAIKSISPANYSIANPFTPRQQDIVGNVYNPSGDDINQFEQGQSFNKFASNPNTLNEPPIPTEADTTMNDLQMGNEPMGAVFGENLSGVLNPRQQRKADRRSRRADRRANRQGGFQNFVRQSVGGALTGIMPR